MLHKLARAMNHSVAVSGDIQKHTTFSLVYCMMKEAIAGSNEYVRMMETMRRSPGTIPRVTTHGSTTRFRPVLAVCYSEIRRPVNQRCLNLMLLEDGQEFHPSYMRQ